MKNIIVFISFFAFFSCGNEKPKSNKEVKQPIKEAASSVLPSGENADKKTVTDVLEPTKNASEVQQELIEKAKMEKETPVVAQDVKDKIKEKTNKVNQPIKDSPKVVENVSNTNPVAKEKLAKEMEEKKRLAQAENEKKLAEAQKLPNEKAAIAAKEKAEKEKQTAKIQDFKDEKPPEPAPPALTHGPFDALLKKHVSATGKVNYKGLKSDESKLNAYLNQLEGTPVDKSWSKNKKMAYWINAYNAYTIKLILKNYPIASITKLHGGKPWDVKWIKLDGRTLSLNNIENDILRPTYKDARIHFAVNCAAKSCPPLLNRAWTADNLNANFEKQAKAFINNSKYNTISGSKAEVSKIFEWYAEDFGDLKNYLNKYAQTQIVSGTEIKYKEYDWALND